MAKSTPAGVAQLDASPSHLMHRVLQLALDIYAAEAGAGALTQRQYAVLAAVSANEGASQTWLVRATGIDRSTLADLVGRMIAKGHLERERSAEDARANTVKLSAAGREALAAARPRVEAADARILALLGPKKRAAFVEALRRLARAEEASLPPGPAPSDKDRKALKKARKKARKADRRDAAAAGLAGAGPAAPDPAPAPDPSPEP